MPMFDYLCEVCGPFESLEPVANSDWAQCPGCGGKAHRHWTTMPTSGVIADDIPGGVTLENYGPTPIKVYSHTERRRIMKERGLEEAVRHVGVPGTDKSPHTTDWSAGSIDPQTLENARVLVSRQGGIRGDEVDMPYESAIRKFNIQSGPEDIKHVKEIIDIIDRRK